MQSADKLLSTAFMGQPTETRRLQAASKGTKTNPFRTALGRKDGKGLRILLIILMLLAAGEFVWRGPLRFPYTSNWNDLAQNYAAARLWLRGQNFARPENFADLWKSELHETLTPGTLRTHLAPPPGTLVMLAPIAALPWPIARLVWLVLLTSASVITIWALARSAGFTIEKARTIAFAAFCLALAPFHTGIAAGNETILVVGLCAVGILAAGAENEITAGLLFGAACSLKPHLGSFLVLYYLVRQRWRLFATAVAFTVLLVLVAAIWLQFHGVSWVRDYFNNVAVLATQNSFDDFTSANPIRFMLINLQVFFYSFTRGATSANLSSLATGGLLIATWTFFTLRAPGKETDALALATIAVIGLLPVYHRLYDASLLAIPLCWCMDEFTGQMRTVARTALVLMAPFLAPGAALLQQLARNGRIPVSWLSSWWWESIVMPHQVWLLLLLALTLLYGLACKSRRNAQKSHSVRTTPVI